MISVAQPVPVATDDAILGKHSNWATFYFYSAPHNPLAVMIVSEMLGEDRVETKQ